MGNKEEMKTINYVGNSQRGWQGSMGGIVNATIAQVWTMVSQSSRLPKRFLMIEKCTDLVGEKGAPGYIWLVLGFMFPHKGGDRSWIKERLVLMDASSHSYIYRIEASNIG